MSVVRSILRSLVAADVRFVIVGGVAVLLHGHIRATKDLDLVIDLAPDQARRAIRALVDAGLQPTVPVDPFTFADPAVRGAWVKEKNMLVFQLTDPADPRRNVDIFAENPIDFETLWARSVLLPLDDMLIRIASIPDLIAMKRSSGRPVDLDDIAQLEKLESNRGR